MSPMSDKDYLRIKATTPYYNFVRKFAFPTLQEILLALLFIDTMGSIFVYYVHSPSFGSVATGFTVGLLIFAAPSTISALMIRGLTLRRDPLFNLRRCFALSLFSSIIWIGMMVIGAFASRIFHSFTFPSDAFYLGMFVAAPFRAISIFSMSSTGYASKSFSAAFEPFLCLISASFIFQLSIVEGALTFVTSTFISFVYTTLIISYIEGRGLKKIGTSPLHMFRGFLLDWLDRSSDVLERQLEKVSSEQELNTTVLGFRQKGNENSSGILVASNFHPGPFLNVGSSALPQAIQNSLEKEMNAVVAVPHGISGHEMNLVSQEQNQKVVKEIIGVADFSNFELHATRLVRVNSGNATASCQVFGNCSLVTITLSPNDMEDIPLNIGVELTSVGRRFFRDIALIDAHNSIKRATTLDEEDQRDIVKSAKEAIERAAGAPTSSFRFGAARIDLNEFTLEQGIGPGGLVAFVVEVGGQLSGYLIVDGNNMKAGFREKILQAMKELDIEAGEVMTTDTHVVNGIVTAKLGYHPVGEAVDENVFMKKVVTVFSEAKRNLEDSEASSVSFETHVKTLGLDLFKNMTEFIYHTSKLVAFSMIPTLLISGIVFILIVIKP
jgi:putative membrane protein